MTGCVEFLAHCNVTLKGIGCVLLSQRIAAGFSLNSLEQTSRRRRHHHHAAGDHHHIEDRGYYGDSAFNCLQLAR
jgi:hypothetical protein